MPRSKTSMPELVSPQNRMETTWAFQPSWVVLPAHELDPYMLPGGMGASPVEKSQENYKPTSGRRTG